eukprot:1196199-Prorocentrum_minimum.AAC.1
MVGGGAGAGDVGQRAVRAEPGARAAGQEVGSAAGHRRRQVPRGQVQVRAAAADGRRVLGRESVVNLAVVGGEVLAPVWPSPPMPPRRASSPGHTRALRYARGAYPRPIVVALGLPFSRTRAWFRDLTRLSALVVASEDDIAGALASHAGKKAQEPKKEDAKKEEPKKEEPKKEASAAPSLPPKKEKKPKSGKK